MGVTFDPHKTLQKNGLRDASGLESEKPMKRLPFFRLPHPRQFCTLSKFFSFLFYPKETLFTGLAPSRPHYYY